MSGGQATLTAVGELNNIKTGSMYHRQRPKSTPLARSPHLTLNHNSQTSSRPETAVFSGHIQCERVQQLEHEPTQQYKFQSHLAVRRNKIPPWQKSPEVPVTRLQLGHGYILSKNKTSSHVTLQDEFFEPSIHKNSSGKTDGDVVRDTLIQQLQQQISDLSQHLEDERLSHQLTKYKAEQVLRDTTDHLNVEFQQQIRDMRAEQEQELLQQKQKIQSEHTKVQNTLEHQISRMAKEIEILQSAFETYRGSLHTEAAQKWSTKEDEHKLKCVEEKQQAVHDAKTRLFQEWDQERANMAREHQKAIEAIRKESERKIEGLLNKFSNAAADVEKFKETTSLLEETRSQLESMTEHYKVACQQLTVVANQLTETKVRLVDFEERFDDKVSQVDDKYRHRLQELMTQNTEIKRMFVHKCGQLCEEKANSDYKRAQRVKSAKDTMQRLLQSEEQANLSITLSGPENKNKCVQNRPLSASDTRWETRAELDTASATNHVG